MSFQSEAELENWLINELQQQFGYSYYKIIEDSLNKILSGIDCEPFKIDRIFVGNKGGVGNSFTGPGFRPTGSGSNPGASRGNFRN